MSVITKILAFAAFAVFFYPHTSRALVVSPMVTDLSLQSGESESFTLAIGSDIQASAVDLSLAAVTFGAAYSDVVFQPIGDLSSWISLSEENFTMTENNVRSVEVTVSIPADTQPTASPFAILVNEAPDTGGVSLTTSVAALVFLTVDGDELPVDVDLESCTVDANSDGSYSLTASITNRGSGILQPSGFVRVRNMLGFVIEQDEFALDGRTPAGYTRTYTWTTDAPDSYFGRAWKDVRGLRFGRLTMYCEIDGAMPTMSRAWVFPWELFVVSAIVVGAGAGTLIWRRRAGK